MAAIAIPRADVAPEEVIRAMRAGFGARYHVLPGTQASNTLGTPTPTNPTRSWPASDPAACGAPRCASTAAAADAQIQVATPPGLP